ncbi:MAG TPA: hypothetical protein VGH29_07600, partial [Candidatus Binataceae bacterium]
MSSYRQSILTPWRGRGAIAAAALVALTAALAGGCRSEDNVQAPAPPAVTVAHPAARAVADYIDFTGNT